MYFYPYYLHLLNLFSFTHYNVLPNSNIIPPYNKNKSIMLWSISRRRIWHNAEYVTYYNYYTKDYEFGGTRYLNYEDVINAALSL